MIEKIADVFKMNWTDFILEDKIMTTNEDYQLTLKMEVLKEQAAAVGAAISRQLTALKIDTETDPLYVLYLQVGYVETTQILLAKDEQELTRIQGYLDGVKQYIELLKTTREVA
jgi:HTH-type transcriptional regulator / antitoxin PezA